MSIIRFFKSIISVLLVFSILMPDFLRAMENEINETQINTLPIKPSNTVKTSNNQTDFDSLSSDDNSSSPSKTPNDSKSSSPENSGEQKLDLPFSTLPLNNLIVGDSQQISSKDSDLSTSSQSLTPSPTKSSIPLHSIISTLIIPQEEKKEEKIIDPKVLPSNIVNQTVEQLPSSQTTEKQEILKITESKKEQKKSPATVNSQTKSTMFQTGNTIYIIEEREVDLNKKELSQTQSTESMGSNNLETTLKEEVEIFEVDDKKVLTNSSTASSNNKPNARIELLKEAFSHLNKTLEKSLSSTVKESTVGKTLSINEGEEEFNEKTPLNVSFTNQKPIDIEKDNSHALKLEECLKNILIEDEEKTAQAFEEWIEKASEKTLCQELESFFKNSGALGSLFAQDLENLLKENSGLAKITIQDWLTHMGLDKNAKTGKIQILSKEMIQLYELFNQALSYHIATTLFKDKIPEEDLEKFKTFLLHLKDYTIDGKLTWKQIVGALGGAAIGGLAAYAFYLVFGWGFLEIFTYYNFDLRGSGTVTRNVAPILAGFMTFDAVVRNTKLFIDYFTPSTKNFTVPMDKQIARSLWRKKVGSYLWSLLPAGVPLYYYYQYTPGNWKWKFWAFGGFLYLNSIWDNSSRLVSNTEKIAQKQSIQKIKENYPTELQEAKTSLLKEIEKSDIYLNTASQKEISERYEEVYSTLLSQIDKLAPNNQKLSQILHLLIFFLELGNLKTSEFSLLSTHSSVEMISQTEKKDVKIFIDDEKEDNSFQINKIKEIEKPKTSKGIGSTIASYALPIMGSPVLWWGAKYMWSTVITCVRDNNCWISPTTDVVIAGSFLGVLTWATVSVVQHFSIKKNVGDLPKLPKTESQPPLRKAWEVGNYVVASGLTIPDFMLWANATFGWNPLVKYTLMSCATAAEVSSTADSLNGSTNEFITGVNRVLSLAGWAPEGFQRQKLIEINNELKQFIQTFKPEVLKIFWKVLPSLRQSWHEGTDIKQKDLEKLFDSSVLKAFTQFSSNLKKKRERKIESELKEFTFIDEKEENK